MFDMILAGVLTLAVFVAAALFVWDRVDRWLVAGLVAGAVSQWVDVFDGPGVSLVSLVLAGLAVVATLVWLVLAITRDVRRHRARRAGRA